MKINIGLFLIFFFSLGAVIPKAIIPEPIKIITEQPEPEFQSWRESYFSGHPLRIGNRVQFLFDDYLVEDKFGLNRVIGPVEKYSGNPLTIGNGMPWEIISDYWGGANLRHIIYDPDEELYKGWYVILRMEPGFETGFNYSTLYAESKDGITWEKPGFDFFLYDETITDAENYADRIVMTGGIKTNIVLHKEKGTALLEEILLDPLATDPNRRYIALVKKTPPGENTRCIVRMYSPDGRAWTLDSDPVLFRGASDGSYSLARDSERERWLLYRRPPTQALIRGFDDFYARRNTKRRVSVSLSEDLREWTYPRNIVLMDEVDDARLEQPGNRMDIDWAQVISYEDVFFGFLSLMDNLTISVPRESHLMWSRDGLDWNRLPERPNFIENGKPGEWDSGSTGGVSIMADGDRDDRLRIYYSGGNTTQGFYGREGEENYPRFRGTGIAFIDKDRFIGLQAGPEGGYLLTRQFVLEGDRISINFRSSLKNPPPVLDSGMITAELLQSAEDHFEARAYPGFSMHDSDPVVAKGDEANYILSWNGSSDLSSLNGKPVYIRFYIQNATLYTFLVNNSL